MLGYIVFDAPGVIVPPEDGWYNTGDVVSIDDEGFIAIRGRLKRFAKIGGETVSLSGGGKRGAPRCIRTTPTPPRRCRTARKGEQIILVTDHAPMPTAP